MTGEALRVFAKKMAVIGLAFGVGVLTATVIIDPGSIMGPGASFGDFLQLSAIVAMFAAPGFAVLRAALLFIRSKSFVMFGLAGALNGLASQFFVGGAVSLQFLTFGLVGGIAVWSAERLLAGGPMVLAATGHADG